MKKSLMLSLLMLATFLQLTAQVFSDTYEVNNYNLLDGGQYALAATNDEGMIFATSGGDSNVFFASELPLIVTKTDYFGQTLWKKVYQPVYDGDIEVAHCPRAIVALENGSFIIAGNIFYEDAGEYYNKIFMQKLDGNGTEDWFHIYDCETLTPLGDDLILHDMCLDWQIADIIFNPATGHIGGVGTVTDFNGKTSMLTFIADAGNGNVVNARLQQFDFEQGSEMGVTIKLEDDNYYILGSSSYMIGDQSYLHPLVIRTDAYLTTAWTRMYSEQSSSERMFQINPIDMVVNSHGECVLLGSRNQDINHSFNQLTLLSLDMNGRPLWDNTIFYNKADENSGFWNTQLAIDEEDNLYIGLDQATQGPGLVKTNAGGSPQWYVSYGEEELMKELKAMTFIPSDYQASIGMIGDIHSLTSNEEVWLNRIDAKDGNNGCSMKELRVNSMNIEYLNFSASLTEVKLNMGHYKLESEISEPGFIQKRCGQTIYPEQY